MINVRRPWKHEPEPEVQAPAGAAGILQIPAVLLPRTSKADDDKFMKDLMDAMMAPISSTSQASSQAPFLLWTGPVSIDPVDPWDKLVNEF